MFCVHQRPIKTVWESDRVYNKIDMWLKIHTADENPLLGSAGVEFLSTEHSRVSIG